MNIKNFNEFIGYRELAKFVKEYFMDEKNPKKLSVLVDAEDMDRFMYEIGCAFPENSNIAYLYDYSSQYYLVIFLKRFDGEILASVLEGIERDDKFGGVSGNVLVPEDVVIDFSFDNVDQGAKPVIFPYRVRFEDMFYDDYLDEDEVDKDSDDCCAEDDKEDCPEKETDETNPFREYTEIERNDTINRNNSGKIINYTFSADYKNKDDKKVSVYLSVDAENDEGLLKNIWRVFSPLI